MTTLAALYELEGVPSMYQPVEAQLEMHGTAAIFIWQLEMQGYDPVEPNEDGVLDWKPKLGLLDPSTDEGRLYMIALALAELQNPGSLNVTEMRALLESIPALIDLYEATLPDVIPARQQLRELAASET